MLIFLLVIVGLSVLILGHEAGHFFAAKLFRLKVDEFGFGFPPRIWAWRPKRKRPKDVIARSGATKQSSGIATPRRGVGARDDGAEDETLRQARGETEYSVNWLPFGGFVKIAGENDSLHPVIPSRAEGESRTKVREPEESRRIAAPLARNEDVVSESEKQRLFFFQPAWKKAIIVGSGVAVNFILGWFLLSAVLMVGLPTALVVGGVQPGSPAEMVGIRENDLILGFSDSQSFISFVNENRGKEIVLNVRRGGEELAVATVPKADVGPNEGALGVLFFEGGEEGRGFFAATWEGLRRSLYVCWAVIAALFNLIKNLLLQGSLLEGVVGPIGVFAVAYDAGGLGLTYLLQLVAMISLNLAVVNLIPFPALDGGRLLLILAEKIKGSPLPRKIEAYTNAIGFAFLIVLMALLTARDVGGLL